MKAIIIQGSSRSFGNTRTIVETFREAVPADLVDLNTLTIGFYDYEHGNRDDDFFGVMNRIVEYDLIIFATPVYWYTMSAQLKAFFDRITECLRTEKELGRKLRDKSMAAIAVGSDADEVEGFFVPFRETAGYLGMKYLGHLHAWIEHDDLDPSVREIVLRFAAEVKSAMAEPEMK